MENTSFKFKKWSFRFLIYTIITQVGLSYLIAIYNSISYDQNVFSRNLQILSAVNIITLIIGISFLIISLINKEDKNYQIYAGIVIYPILAVYTLLSFIG
ncbi:hypothetical protein SAMN04489761_3761 [Tenacibaculum sp. MAR_2009_124]|uniref:hypothetical protein n=1 Tax=Tenacibaculum sp. MAR_2009_124 TaxID=1250059 RepID=UPI00089C5516|nr:hypothetical protein [Tenacibaculum sp. MAR_2009_124]SEC84823.1 hypothetical protein SAMN04489761_3761 [Tenacibaculum sp. MAR_2009_124]